MYSTEKGDNKNMKGENSSKCMYIRNIAVIPLKWKDIRNADITTDRRYMRSIADIPKLAEMPAARRLVTSSNNRYAQRS